MEKESTYKDVNRNDYMRAFLVELIGQKQMISFETQGKRIVDFICSDERVTGKRKKLEMVAVSPSDKYADKIDTFDEQNRARDKQGHILIAPCKAHSKEFLKKARKITNSYKM